MIQPHQRRRTVRRTALALTAAALLFAELAGCASSSTSPTATAAAAGAAIGVASPSVPVTTTRPTAPPVAGVAGRLRVGSSSVNVLCTGRQSTNATIVLVAGMPDPLTKFTALQATLSRTARVCSYDRPGEGVSPKPATPQSLSDAAALLNGVLDAARVNGKVVVVGHSLGGLIATQFAHQYPTRVQAVVLLDASAPSVGGALQSLIPAAATGPAAEVRGEASSLSSAATNPEKLVYTGQPLGSLGDTPLTVVQHGQPIYSVLPQYATRLQQIWTRGQQQLAQLSTSSTLITAGKSGHYIYLDQQALTIQLIDHAATG